MLVMAMRVVTGRRNRRRNRHGHGIRSASARICMLYKKMMYMYQGSFINNTFYNIRNYINSEIIYMYLQVLVCSCCDLENRYIISAKKIENIQF